MVSTRSQNRKTRSGTRLSVKEGRVNKTLTTPRRGRAKPKLPTAKQVENAINGKKNNSATPAQMNNLVMEVAANNAQLANNLKKVANNNRPKNNKPANKPVNKPVKVNKPVNKPVKVNKPVNKPAKKSIIKKLKNKFIGPRPAAPPANLKRLRVNIAKRLSNVEPNRNVRMGVLKRVNKKIAELSAIINKAEAGNAWLRRKSTVARRNVNQKTMNKYKLILEGGIEGKSSYRIGKKKCMSYKKSELMTLANTNNKKLTKDKLCKIIKEKNATPQAPVVTPKITNKAKTCKTMKLAQLKNIAGNKAKTIKGRVTKRKLCEIINAKNNANNRGGKRKHIRFNNNGMVIN